MRLNPRQLAVGGAIALASMAGFGAITAASADDGSPKVEHQTPNDDRGHDTKTDHNCPKDRDGSDTSTSSSSSDA